MAAGVRRLSGADLGISVTGIAGPDSDGTDKPVGLCYVAIDARTIPPATKGGNRAGATGEYNRYVNASRALNLVRLYIERMADKA